MAQGIISNKTLTLQLTEQLRKDILLGVLPSGSRVTVQTIATRYNTSAIPVRESMRTLIGESLLEMHPYKGSTVRNVDYKFICGLYDILRSMEELIFESIEGHWTEDLRTYVEGVNERIRQIKTNDQIVKDFYRLNREFHDALEQFCENERALELRKYYSMCVEILAEGGKPHSLERIQSIYEEHKEIIEALDSGDSLRIRNSYIQHSLKSKKEFLNQISEIRRS